MKLELETKRLILRQPKKSDWKDIFEGVSDYDVSKMTSHIPYPYKQNDAKKHISKIIKESKQKFPNSYVFYIELKSEKKVIGAIGIHKINRISLVGETGSWINKKYWRNGYITEAKIAANDFAFNKLKLRRLETKVYTDNIASNATQIKMGYKLEGMQRKSVKSVASGKIHDANIYGLLKEDWKKIRPSLITHNK